MAAMTDRRKSTETQRGLAARRVVRALDRAALATIHAEHRAPYASLVTVATDHAGCPLMLLSDLAEHTRNLAKAPEASLLFDATGGLENPLTGTRVTAMGTVSRIDGEQEKEGLAARFVARHPDAALYAGFGDFNLYRLSVERVHVVAGFGEIYWLPSEAFLAGADRTAGISAAEPGIIAHMNEDHADAVHLFADVFAGGADDGSWKLTAADCDGIDIGLDDVRKRIPFCDPVFTVADIRAALVSLVEKARRTAENR